MNHKIQKKKKDKYLFLYIKVHLLLPFFHFTLKLPQHSTFDTLPKAVVEVKKMSMPQRQGTYAPISTGSDFKG